MAKRERKKVNLQTKDLYHRKKSPKKVKNKSQLPKS